MGDLDTSYLQFHLNGKTTQLFDGGRSLRSGIGTVVASCLILISARVGLRATSIATQTSRGELPNGITLASIEALPAILNSSATALDFDLYRRAQILEFSQNTEQAEAALNRGETTEARKLFAAAMYKAFPLSENPFVMQVIKNFEARFAALDAPSDPDIPPASDNTRLQERAQSIFAKLMRLGVPLILWRWFVSQMSKAPDQFAQLEADVRRLIVHRTGVFFHDVVGLEAAKRALWESVVLPSLKPKIFIGLRAPARGILLYGPPGNGKTFLAKAVAGECNATFFAVSASSLTSKWYGDTEKLVKALFAVATKRAPSLIFLDEIDSMLSGRSSSEDECSRRLKTEFLVQLDGITTEAVRAKGNRERVIVLAATNRPFDLDEALLRRFPVQIYVPMPDALARESLLNASLSKQPNSLSAEDLMALAQRTERFSSSDLVNLCREASMMGLRKLHPSEFLRLQPDHMQPISRQDFEGAMESIRPSVSAAAEQRIERWARPFDLALPSGVSDAMNAATPSQVLEQVLRQNPNYFFNDEESVDGE